MSFSVRRLTTNQQDLQNISIFKNIYQSTLNDLRLTNLQSEYRRVGVNYNQVVKAVHGGQLTEKKALALLYKLEQLTVEYISLNREIIRLTKDFEQWLQR